MSGEVEQHEPVEQETDADFAAGLGIEAPTTTPEPTPAPEATPEPTPEPKYAQITEEELTELRARAALVEEIKTTSKKNFDTAFGKLGALEDHLKKLQGQTPAGEAVSISDEDFAELKEQYPELAEVQIKGLNKVLARMKGTADPDAIEKLVAPRVEKVREEMLEVAFPGWKDEVKTDHFKGWLPSQPEDVRALAASSQVADAAKLLRLYEKAKSAPASTPAPTPVPKQTSTRTRQIAAAVPPRGDGGTPPAPSEDDDFLAGLRSG